MYKKNYNFMIDGKNFFEQPVKNDKVTYENIRKVTIDEEMIIQLVVCQTIPISKNITK